MDERATFASFLPARNEKRKPSGWQRRAGIIELTDSFETGRKNTVYKWSVALFPIHTLKVQSDKEHIGDAECVSTQPSSSRLSSISVSIWKSFTDVSIFARMDL
ncbi:uncharacterized protein LOC116428221 [Nomia melanderi]|uniref:uncharacterized protein LOC116428221 n=1 Tax=Nomia melanderi TaxID=2448451 RepID=UPI003FCDFA56